MLVSDCEITCAPPPVCEVAKELKQQGIDLAINTVVFLVDAGARAELECIAEAAGGEYMDAQDSDSHEDAGDPHRTHRAVQRARDTGRRRSYERYLGASRRGNVLDQAAGKDS